MYCIFRSLVLFLMIIEDALAKCEVKIKSQLKHRVCGGLVNLLNFPTVRPSKWWPRDRMPDTG